MSLSLETEQRVNKCRTRNTNIHTNTLLTFEESTDSEPTTVEIIMKIVIMLHPPPINVPWSLAQFNMLKTVK